MATLAQRGTRTWVLQHLFMQMESEPVDLSFPLSRPPALTLFMSSVVGDWYLNAPASRLSMGAASRATSWRLLSGDETGGPAEAAAMATLAAVTRPERICIPACVEVLLKASERNGCGFEALRWVLAASYIELLLARMMV